MKYSGDYLSKLLLTRLKRSLFRTKARVITVMILITLSSYAGVSFAEYNRNMKSVYIDFYAETNLADLIISDSEQPEENFSRICQEYEDWLCESRLKLSGQTQFTNDTGTHWISSVWYGITSNQVSRLYMIEGELAEKKNEVVIDAHFADAHELVIGDTLTIGAGFGMHEVNISGIANNPLICGIPPKVVYFPMQLILLWVILMHPILLRFLVSIAMCEMNFISTFPVRQILIFQVQLISMKERH